MKVDNIKIYETNTNTKNPPIWQILW